jgi:hypothetical protein
MTQGAVTPLLARALNSTDRRLGHQALRAAGAWVEENGLTAAHRVVRRARLLHDRLVVDEFGPLARRIVDDGNVILIGLAHPTLRRALAPRVRLRVAPEHLAQLIDAVRACRRGAPLDFEIARLESLRPRHVRVWIEGRDRAAGAEMVSTELSRLGIRVAWAEP